MSRRENKEESSGSGWSTLATVGGMVAAFGLGAFIFGSKSETPQSHSTSSSRPYYPPPPPPQSQPRPQHNASPEECLVCLESIDVERLPCGHYFHKDCIKQWKNAKDSRELIPDCPKCRQPF